MHTFGSPESILLHVLTSEQLPLWMGSPEKTCGVTPALVATVCIAAPLLSTHMEAVMCARDLTQALKQSKFHGEKHHIVSHKHVRGKRL